VNSAHQLQNTQCVGMVVSVMASTQACLQILNQRVKFQRPGCSKQEQKFPTYYGQDQPFGTCSPFWSYWSVWTDAVYPWHSQVSSCHGDRPWSQPPLPVQE